MMEQIQYINVDDIIPNRFQPRKKFDEDDLNELAESIKQHGIIQPLVLRRLGNKFEIIAGERRYKAANIVGLKQVPSIVMDLDDRTSAEIALAENIQRKDLTAIEKAKSYKQILGLGQITQEELAKKMGKSQPTVSNTLRLLELTDEVQQALLQNRISERHARSLLSLKNPELQKEMLNEIIKNRMTVRETDLAIKEMLKKNDNVNNTPQEEKIMIPTKEEEIIDFSNENVPKENNIIKDTNIVELENNKEIIKDIPDFDQIDINKENKKGFLNNYINLDDEAANMNADTEDNNNEFNNFIDIPENEPILNINKEKEEKEVSETPMISEPINKNNNNYGYVNNDNLNQNNISQNPETYSNGGMMPPQQPQGGMYQPYPGPNIPYQDPNFINPYQQGMSNQMTNPYQSMGMMPPQQLQGGMYQPYPGPNIPYQDPNFTNPYQQGIQNPYQNGGIMPAIDNMQNNVQENFGMPNQDNNIYPPNPDTVDENNVIEPNQDVVPQAIIMQHDITGAVAVIRNTVMNLQNNGYMIDMAEDDLANAYNINIKIEK